MKHTVSPHRRPAGRQARVLLLLAWASASISALAGNTAPEKSVCWAANIGWLNWRPDAVIGVEVGQFICSGYVYSPNVGWINLGSGKPADGMLYQNNSASDFGVNVDETGNLRGYAYGSNIGWISFESNGAPRVDLNTGQLSGFAYGANIGWIDLGGAASLVVDSIAPGADTDHDNIPDAWELLYAGDLVTFDQSSDSDFDGQSDLQEYLADTNPLDEKDHLEVLSYSVTPDKANMTITWTSKPTRRYQVQARSALDSSEAWSDSGLGVQPPDGAVTTRTAPVTAPLEFFRIRALRPLSP